MKTSLSLPAAGVSATKPRASSAVAGRLLVVAILAVWIVGFFAGFDIALLILTVIGFIAAAIGLFAPSTGLMGIAMLAVLDAITRDLLADNGMLPWNSFNYWLLLVVLLSVPFIIRLNDPHSRLLEVFILTLSVGVAYSLSYRTGIQDVFNLVTVFGMLVYFARSVDDRDAFLWTAYVVGVLGAGGGMVYYLQIADLPYINPNGIAFFPLTAMFAIALAMLRIPDDKPSARYILLALAVINMLWVFLSGSRGNMATGLFVLLFLLTRIRRFSTAALVLSAAVGVALLASSFFVEQQQFVLHRLQRSFDPNVSLNSRTSGRSNIAAAGIELFFKNPLGVGTGSFATAVAESDALAGRNRPAHSAWIKTLAENGIPGIIILALYVLSFAWIGWRRRREPGILATGVLVTGAIAIGFFSKELQGKGYWFLAAGGTALLHAESMVENLSKKYRRFGRGRRSYRRLAENRTPTNGDNDGKLE
jgi:O-antigen ligase